VARSIFFYTDSEILGGAEEALLTLIESLDRAAWRPTLLVAEPPLIPLVAGRAHELEVPVRPVTQMPLGVTGAARVPAFVRMLRRERPDGFHAHLSWPLGAKYALMAAVLARVPAVLATVQLVPPFELDRSSLLQLRLLAAGVGRYIAVSSDARNQLVGRLRWPAHKVEVVHNAVRKDRFAGAAGNVLRDQLSSGRARPIVLTCARLDAQKGHGVLLQAATELPDVLFVLAGEGAEREALEQQASALGLVDRVLFLGHRSDVPELLAACDVFALPSLYEGSSLAILEAMAAGRPVVSSAIPGTEELIADGETGLLVPPGDAHALAQALRRLLAQADLRTELATRAREHVARHFTAEAMARRVMQMYEELLEDARRDS
jgi:glycosyltransferase involved in cell wall biosynthesis